MIKEPVNFLSVGSKTFLLGEYAAIERAPALLVATKPRFFLEVKAKHHPYEPHFDQFNLASPAGKYLAKYYEDFKNFELDFFDPHFGKGGLGASGAQFILAYIAREVCILGKDLKNINVNTLKEAYLQFAYRGLGKPPSAYDIYSQFIGGIIYIDPANNILHEHPWPFKNLGFVLARTGFKISTHEHLKFIKHIDVIPLEKIIRSAEQALTQKKEKAFIEAVIAYQQALQTQGFTCERSLELIKKIRLNRHVHAIKGCGALGADVLLILCDKGKIAAISNWLKMDDIKVVANSLFLTSGLALEYSRKSADET